MDDGSEAVRILPHKLARELNADELKMVAGADPLPGEWRTTGDADCGDASRTGVDTAGNTVSDCDL